MITKYTLFLLFIISKSIAFANPSFDRPLSLSEVVDIALQTHPETRQAWWNAQRAASTVGVAESAYYPKLDFNANISNGRDYKFINGPDTTYTSAYADLVLSMMLYDYGERRANVNEAKMALLAANWQSNRIFQKVMVVVLENAYATLHAQEVLQAAFVSLEDAERVFKAAQGLNEAGLTPVSDVYTTRATLAQMNMEVAEQKALLDIQRGKLASSVGLNADAPIQLAPVQGMPEHQQQQISGLIAFAKMQRADLMAKQARVAEACARLDKARSAYGPKLSLAGRGGSDHYFSDKAHGVHYQIGLNLDMPLFNGFQTMYQNRIAADDVQISMEELAQLELDIALEVLTYSRSLEAAQEMLCFAKENLDNALKAYEGALEKYRAGKERIAEVSNAQQQLAAARVRFSDVKTRWLVSQANLAYATGTIGCN
jgi:outer membrane protein